MKIIDTKTNIMEINKTFTIDIGKSVEIQIYKYGVDNQLLNDYDGGWDFQRPQDKELYESLTEAKQDKVTDFIEDISLFN